MDERSGGTKPDTRGNDRGPAEKEVVPIPSATKVRLLLFDFLVFICVQSTGILCTYC